MDARFHSSTKRLCSVKNYKFKIIFECDVFMTLIRGRRFDQLVKFDVCTSSSVEELKCRQVCMQIKCMQVCTHVQTELHFIFR